MSLAAMLGDIINGLLHKPVTQLYPFERPKTAERFRSLLDWDGECCTGCRLCVKDCPTGALELTTIDQKAKRFVMGYRVDLCVFCGQCVASCPFDCLKMTTNQWELASLNREPFTNLFGTEEDKAIALARSSEENTKETDNA